MQRQIRQRRIIHRPTARQRPRRRVHHAPQPQRRGCRALGEGRGEGRRAMAAPEPFGDDQRIEQQPVIPRRGLREGAIGRDQPCDGARQVPRPARRHRCVAEHQANHEQPRRLADRVVVVLRGGIGAGRLDAARMGRQQRPHRRGGRLVRFQQGEGEAQMQRPQRRFLATGPGRATKRRIGLGPAAQHGFGARQMLPSRRQPRRLGQQGQGEQAVRLPDRTNVARREQIQAQSGGIGWKGPVPAGCDGGLGGGGQRGGVARQPVAGQAVRQQPAGRQGDIRQCARGQPAAQEQPVPGREQAGAWPQAPGGIGHQPRPRGTTACRGRYSLGQDGALGQGVLSGG